MRFRNNLVDTVLEQIRTDLPPELICDHGYSRIAKVASMIPSDYTNFWGMEFRLGHPETLADILFETRKNSPGHRLLSGMESSNLDELCARKPCWQKLRSFANSWADPESTFNSQINNIWLEFDTEDAGTPEKMQKVIDQPNFFFGPEENISPDDFRHSIEKAMDLFERPSPPKKILKEFTDSLPSGASLFQVGMMLTRQDDHGLRMCISDISPENISGWLKDVQPQIDKAFLDSFFKAVMPVTGHVTLGLNLCENGIDPAIGIECYMDWLNDDPKQWAGLMDLVSECGLCLPGKKRGFFSYPGITQSPMPDRIEQDILYLNIFRKIHHIKITISKGSMTQAKAYLAVFRPVVDTRSLTANIENRGWGEK